MILKTFNREGKANFDLAVLILRIGIGGMMLTHGLPKLYKFFGDEPIAFASVMGMGPELSLALAVFAEVVCSLLIIVGFRTRLASIPLLITMVVAVFVIHGDDPFSKQEMGLLYLMGYVILLLTGSGKYSVDQIRKQHPKGGRSNAYGEIV